MTDRGSRSPVLASLADFVSAMLRPRTPLAKAIVFALCLKLVVAVSMRVFLFSGDARVPVDDRTISRLIGVTAAPAPNH